MTLKAVLENMKTRRKFNVPNPTLHTIRNSRGKIKAAFEKNNLWKIEKIEQYRASGCRRSTIEISIQRNQNISISDSLFGILFGICDFEY